MSRRRQEDIEESFSQAEEVEQKVQHDQGPIAHSQSQGQDLLENPEIDYKKIQILDQYEIDSADLQSINRADIRQIRKAQKELDRRDRVQKQAEGDLSDLMDDDDSAQQMRRRHQEYYFNQEEEQEQIQEQRYIDPQDCKGKLHQWIRDDHTKKYIQKKFIKFISQFTLDNKNTIYFKKVLEMVHLNKESIQISYLHFKQVSPTLAIWLGMEPIYLIPELNAILYTFICKRFPNFKNIIKEVFVKFFELPIHDKIRSLRVQHISKLVNIKGVCTVRGEIFNRLIKIVYKCYRCGEQKGPYFVNSQVSISLGVCRSCQQNGPYVVVKNKSIYGNNQKIVIQQSPSDVDAGRIPRTKQVILIGDNVDSIKPGQQAQIIGIYVMKYECNINIRQGFPIFTTFIEANSITKLNDKKNFSSVQEAKIIEFSKRKDFDQIIYNSMAPSIYGYPDIKMALTFALFGGTEKFNQEKMHRIRGDINVLLLGDPGTAKSQFLKSIQRVFYKCVYATGKGASAVGLTASVKQDHQTGEWKLEAGAMVLADKGICLIDQFDKMNEGDRTSIHEAMEQQTISISKAGIVAQLKARCSVIAAANPVQGRYNQTLSFIDNISLTDPIISRFDIIKIVKDKCNEQIDKNLSTFVINSHMTNHPYLSQFSQQVQQLSSQQKSIEVCQPQFLKQYIKYAREKFNQTTIGQNSADMINDFYIKLRESSEQSGGLRITTRHLQSMIRICQAHARMHLRQQTNREDAKIAIRTMLKSYIETQKHGPASKIQKQFKFYL